MSSFRLATWVTIVTFILTVGKFSEAGIARREVVLASRGGGYEEDVAVAGSDMLSMEGIKSKISDWAGAAYDYIKDFMEKAQALWKWFTSRDEWRNKPRGRPVPPPESDEEDSDDHKPKATPWFDDDDDYKTKTTVSDDDDYDYKTKTTVSDDDDDDYRTESADADDDYKTENTPLDESSASSSTKAAGDEDATVATTQIDTIPTANSGSESEQTAPDDTSAVPSATVTPSESVGTDADTTLEETTESTPGESEATTTENPEDRKEETVSTTEILPTEEDESTPIASNTIDDSVTPKYTEPDVVVSTAETSTDAPDVTHNPITPTGDGTFVIVADD